MEKEVYLREYNLTDHPGMDVVEFGDHDDWLEERRVGIGGSDVGAIMGLNEYSSPLQVYKAKVDGVKKDLSHNVNVRKGTDLEALIRSKYVAPTFDEQGYEVKTVDCMLVNKDYPWLRANLDGIALDKNSTSYEDNVVIEIKYVSEWGAVKWNGNDYLGIPPSYYAQVQTYMLVTGAKKAVVCALFETSWEVKYYTIPRDEDFITQLIKKTKEFYEYNMTMKIPPICKLTVDKEVVVEELKEVKDVETYEDPILDELLAQYRENEQQIKLNTALKEDLKDEIYDRFHKGGRPKYSPNAIKISTYTSTSFDSKQFKEDYPDIYNNYKKTADAIRFTIK